MKAFFEVKSGTEQILLNGLPLTDLLTLLTFCLLVITIVVSIRALKETARSNVLSSSPVLVLRYVITRGTENDAVQVENVGHGTALNIRIENYYTTFIDDMMFIEGTTLKPNKPIHAVLRFQSIDLLLEGKTAAFDTSKSTSRGFFTPEILAHQMMNQKGKLTFRLRYSDIAGTQYISKITISQNRIRVVGYPKKYNLLRKALYSLYICAEKVKMVAVYWPIAHYRQAKVNQELKESYEARDAD